MVAWKLPQLPVAMADLATEFCKVTKVDYVCPSWSVQDQAGSCAILHFENPLPVQPARMHLQTQCDWDIQKHNWRCSAGEHAHLHVTCFNHVIHVYIDMFHK